MIGLVHPLRFGGVWARRARSTAVCKETEAASCRPRPQLGPSNQVEGGTGEDEQPIDVGQSAQLHLPDPGDRFQPSERGFDPRARVLALGVPRVPRGARIDRTAARACHVLRHVGREAQVARKADEIFDVISLSVPTVRGRAGARALWACNIQSPASRSAKPSAWVARASAIRP